MTYFQRKNSEGDIVASNIIEGQDLSSYKTREIPIENGVIIFFTNEIVLIKNSKIFRLVRDISSSVISTILKELDKDFLEKIVSHSHALRKIQGQLKQKIDTIIDSPMLSSRDYTEQIDVVAKKIKNNPDLFADTLLYFRKRVFEIDAHILSFEILYLNQEIDLDFHPHNIRRLLMNVLYAFEDETNVNNIKPIFEFEDDFAENNKIKLDYKTINTVFYNLFDNAFKYTKPYSKIKFNFLLHEKKSFEIVIGMESLRIERDELERVFELGFRGRNAKQTDGSGVGMYVIKKILELNNCNIKILPNYSNMTTSGNHQYVWNEFIISGYLQ
jgi:signal transduction histidine kinase